MEALLTPVYFTELVSGFGLNLILSSGEGTKDKLLIKKGADIEWDKNSKKELQYKYKLSLAYCLLDFLLCSKV
uniref:Uncharacterized protein n=1 Tax=Salix viminalis TaxID=40686 RepID=A0A6N2LTM3_SALVM